MMRSFAISLFLLITTTVSAQRFNTFGISGSYGYTTNTFAVSARVPYTINNSFTISPDFNYFFPEVQTINGTTVSEGSTEYNLNLQYSLLSQAKFTPYLMAGVNFTREVLVIDDPTSTFLLLKLDAGFGANLGVGLKYQYTPTIQFFTEHKYVTGSLGQQVSCIGILYTP